MHTTSERSAGRARLLRLLGVMSIIASLALGVGATAASAATNGFEQEAGKNTYTSEGTLSAQCPEGIAGTPGSDPANKELAPGNTAASFEAGGTVHYVYHDNPNDDSTNFNLEDCVVSYPADKFTASDFNASGQLVNALKKNVLVDDATELDKATLSGVTASTGDIFYSWTAPGNLTAGSWVCNFARDTSTGHGGGGNRKVSPVCYQVRASIVPNPATLQPGTDCDELDTYTIPTTANVTYKVNGVTKAAGTYNLGEGEVVTITAHTAEPYYFANTTTTSWGPWTGSTPTDCPGDVTPAAVANPVQACGVADTYTIPSSNDIEYSVNGTPTVAGTYDLAEGEVVTITAAAINGRTLDPNATASWGPFTGGAIVPCPITPATPTHTVVTTCGVTDSYTIPAQTGVQYKVNGTDKAAGTYALGAGETITITAEPVSPYTFVQGATTSWGPSTGSAVETCGGGGGGSTPEPDPEDANPADPRISRACGEVDEYVIPSRDGVIYRVDGDVVEAGRYELPEGETVEISADAAPGFEIPAGEDDSWLFTGQAVEPCSTTTTTEPILPFTPEPSPAQVEAPPAPAPAAPVLAFTGLETRTMFMAAMTLLGIGLVLMVASKRELRVK